MICLLCEKRQKGEAFEPCLSGGQVFHPVDGIYGVNNVTQLLHAIDECKARRLSLNTLRQTFHTFAETWESFQVRWSLDEKSVPKAFAFSPRLQGVYKQPLREIEEAFVFLEDAYAELDELEAADAAALEALGEAVHTFFRKVCSATALLFKKLENPKGDFGALLSNFGF